MRDRKIPAQPMIIGGQERSQEKLGGARTGCGTKDSQGEPKEP